MSERWKYQIKTGLPFGIGFPVFMTIMEAWSNDSAMVFISWKFVVKLLVMVAVGVFVIGYYNWKAKQKELEKEQQK